MKVIKREPFSLEVKFDGTRIMWKEIARADFNHDGFEDVLLFEAGRYLEGSGHWTSHRLLTRTHSGEWVLKRLNQEKNY